MSSPTESEADRAYEQFSNLLTSKAILGIDDPKLSEADTRSKLIDPVFVNVLNWSEVEIRRESRSTSGYSDYVFGLDAAYLLVEAKRTKPRFRLDVQGKPRKLKLDGVHLLRQKKLRPALEQAQRYASELGAQVAILTNGSQYIFFRPYLPGRSWTTGSAIAFHDTKDIAENFAYFFNLLSRDAVISGALLDELERFEGITEALYVPSQYVRNPDGELVRNPYWTKLSQILTPLLTDQAEDPVAQEIIIRNCYVTTGLSDQADESLDRLLHDSPTRALRDAGVKHTESGRGERFTYQFERDIESRRPGTYVITGGVGSGKTTFLRRFALVVGRGFIQQYCIWIHVDFLTAGSQVTANLDILLEDYLYAEFRRQLESNYPERVPKDGAELRELFSEQIARARLTQLHGVPEESSEWNRRVGDLVEAQYSSNKDYVTALLRSLSKKGLRLVLVLDNTDQQGEAFQEQVFLLSQKLSREHGALCIVALREERFFAAFRRGIFDAFGDRRFHIGSPELRLILKKRLDYGRDALAEAVATQELNVPPEEARRLDEVLASLIRSTTQRNHNIVRMLACVTNGDMRHALDMFRAFLSSGNTNVKKIVDIVETGGTYIVPFHEFAKSAILGSRRYFNGSRSHIVNVFKKSSARGASYITGLRVLARLCTAEGAASEHGEGFVKTATLLREFRTSFGFAADFEEVAGEFSRRGLIESEPPKINKISETTALRVSASGVYYWKYLTRAFAYLDLMWVDTPIGDMKLAKRLAAMAESTDLTVRFDRVRTFLDYVEQEERKELVEVAQRSGPYREEVVGTLRTQVEKEIRLISRKIYSM